MVQQNDDEPVVCDNEDFHESEDSDEPEICEDGIRLHGYFLPHREQPVNRTAASPSFYGRQSATEVHQQTLDMLEDMKSKGIRPGRPPHEIQAMATKAKRQWLASVKKRRDACSKARASRTGALHMYGTAAAGEDGGGDDTRDLRGPTLDATHRHFWNGGEAGVAPPPEEAGRVEEWFAAPFRRAQQRVQQIQHHRHQDTESLRQQRSLAVEGRR